MADLQFNMLIRTIISIKLVYPFNVILAVVAEQFVVVVLKGFDPEKNFVLRRGKSGTSCRWYVNRQIYLFVL